jgi:hypothetical protein
MIFEKKMYSQGTFCADLWRIAQQFRSRCLGFCLRSRLGKLLSYDLKQSKQDVACTGEPRRRQAVARSVQERCGVSEFDKREIGRDASPPYNHRGTVVVASAWLAFYVFAAIHHFIAFGN